MTVEGAGHAVNLYQPEKFNDAVLDLPARERHLTTGAVRDATTRRIGSAGVRRQITVIPSGNLPEGNTLASRFNGLWRHPRLPPPLDRPDRLGLRLAHITHRPALHRRHLPRCHAVPGRPRHYVRCARGHRLRAVRGRLGRPPAQAPDHDRRRPRPRRHHRLRAGRRTDSASCASSSSTSSPFSPASSRRSSMLPTRRTCRRSSSPSSSSKATASSPRARRSPSSAPSASPAGSCSSSRHPARWPSTRCRSCSRPHRCADPQAGA